MTPECRPPADLANVDGWHWVQFGDKRPEPQEWATRGQRGYWHAHHMGLPDWRYLSPVLTPSEAQALRAERDAAVADAKCHNLAVDHWMDMHHQAEAELAALRAEVDKLRKVLDEIDDLAGEGIDTHPIGMSDPRVRDCNKYLGFILDKARAALSGGEEV